MLDCKLSKIIFYTTCILSLNR